MQAMLDDLQKGRRFLLGKRSEPARAAVPA
jgi:hypothetical protein